MTRSENGVEILARSSGDKTETFRAEKVLMAVGRRPLTDNIGLEAMGIGTEKGYLNVDAFMRTNVPGVYAIGDVLPTPALAHLASAEGVVAVEHMAGKETRPINYDQVPGCTYCAPEVGSIGLTEAKAKERGYDVVVGKFPFSAVGKARILNKASGFVKIVAEKKYDEVLGVHIVGPSATELIAEAGAALKLEATSEELVRTIHAHPTLSEAIHEAAEAVSGSRHPHLGRRYARRSGSAPAAHRPAARPRGLDRRPDPALRASLPHREPPPSLRSGDCSRCEWVHDCREIRPPSLTDRACPISAALSRRRRRRRPAAPRVATALLRLGAVGGRRHHRGVRTARRPRHRGRCAGGGLRGARWGVGVVPTDRVVVGSRGVGRH